MELPARPISGGIPVEILDMLPSIRSRQSDGGFDACSSTGSLEK